MRWTLAALVICVGCAGRPRSAPPSVAYPGTLVPTERITGDFLLRQTIAAHYRERDVEFSAVVQKQGGALLLLALTPFGSRAFSLEQRGTEVTFTSYVPRELPFPPRYMLQDLHRTLFLGIDGGPLADGEHVAQRDGEEVIERWEGGRLRSRAFRRLSGDVAGRIEVTYDGGMRWPDVARVVHFHNGWFGYDLTVTTTEMRPLPLR